MARSRATIPCWPRPWSRRDIRRLSRSRRSSSSSRTGPRSRTANATPSNAGIEKHGARLKPLRPVYLADDLFACQSVVESSRPGDDFIFTCKESSHKALYDFVDGAELDRYEVGFAKARLTRRIATGSSTRFRCATARTPCWSTGSASRLQTPKAPSNTGRPWSLPTGHETNVADIVACGRARWKIENESFNVLKNHGYELEHNFGHGENYLAMTLAALNMLAFAWHTVLDLLEPPWRRARDAADKRTSFFVYLATLTRFVVFPDWPGLLEALATFTIPPGLLATPKIE